MSDARFLRQAVAAALIAGGLAAPWFAHDAAAQAQPNLQQIPSREADTTPLNFARLAKPLTPAVVNISSTRRVEQRTQRGRPQLPPPFDQFFRDMPAPGGEGAPPGPDANPGPGQGPRGMALGSGFIIDQAGYVVTNNHVIEDADEVTVILHDETQFKAKVVGADKRTDLALLKIEVQKPLPFVKWGDSEKAEVGEWVLAIGNPFGLGGSVTAGIISATARNIGIGPYDAFLQTDASINRGNSGGPMFNMRGEVIGVNTAIFSPTGGNIGIGFATPSSIAKPVIDQLREGGTVRRGWLGVSIQNLTDEISNALGIKDTKGALVSDVTPNGPAAKAGIKPGDVILEFNGQQVPSSDRLPRMVADTEIGRSVEVNVLREGQRQKLSVTLGDLNRAPSELAQSQTPQREPEQPQPRGTLGLGLAQITPQTRARFGIPENVDGVLVQNVAPNSPAAKRGIQPGDILSQVGQTPVNGPEAVRDAVETARKDGRNNVLMRVQREGASRFVPVPLSESPPG